jgi:hypothetical protein
MSRTLVLRVIGDCEVVAGERAGCGRCQIEEGVGRVRPDLAHDSQNFVLGNGDGTFQNTPNSYVAGGHFINLWTPCVAVADFNGDGLPDLAVTSWQKAGRDHFHQRGRPPNQHKNLSNSVCLSLACAMSFLATM